MSVDFYTCAKCDDNFSEYKSGYTFCEECNNNFCSRKCASLKEVDEDVEEEPEEENVEEEAEEDLEEYQEPKKNCCICRKEEANNYILFYALLRHYKITRYDAMKIWQDEKEDD